MEVCIIADGFETVREETVVGIVADISLEHLEATTNNGKITVGHFNYNVRKKKKTCVQSHRKRAERYNMTDIWEND